MLARFARVPRIAVGLAGAVILAGGVFARTATAVSPPADPRFGMIGIVQGQTARLNLVNTASPAATLVPPGPCRAGLRFLDADGNVLARLGAEVEAGHSTFLDFSPSIVPVNTLDDAVVPIRTEVRAAVHFDDLFPPGPCRVNVEIFDNATGKTTVWAPPGPCRRGACQAGQ